MTFGFLPWSHSIVLRRVGGKQIGFLHGRRLERVHGDCLAETLLADEVVVATAFGRLFLHGKVALDATLRLLLICFCDVLL